MTVSAAGRTRVAEENRVSKRGLTIKYFAGLVDATKKVPVCKKSFCSIFGVCSDRVLRVAQYYAEHGTARPETRGGARKVAEHAEAREAVITHITSFMCRASHYGRRGCPGRKYLPSDFSVAKMHKLFQDQNHQEITYSLYYSVFRSKFNLGFGHPATDTCSTCAAHNQRVHDESIPVPERQLEAASFLLHRRRARTFYDRMNLCPDSSVTVCFDMMENLVLPKSPIGQTYYSRQLYKYIFGVVVHQGKDSHQSLDDVFLFTWCENENKKDSNMIASALNYCFTDRIRRRLEGATVLRLFSDSCYGQNKNLNVMAMLCALRKKTYPNLAIEYTFPVRGHSFLPADRVFGRIELELRRRETILLPSEYDTVLRKHGTVLVYNEQWQAFDYKAATAAHTKSTRSFKISEAKVLRVESDSIDMKTSYNGEFCRHSILKRGKRWDQFSPSVLPLTNTVKAAKKKDVLALLDPIGASPAVREFYEAALSDAGGAAAATAPSDASESDEDS